MGFRARWNRPPTNEELTGLVREYVREIALYRHAVAMGLDKNDPTVRRMLARKLQTLTQNLMRARFQDPKICCLLRGSDIAMRSEARGSPVDPPRNQE